MESDPVRYFGMLLNMCIRDDWKKESLLAVTALMFALGIGASVVTVYALSTVGLLI
ncbi:MAG: hypothetical protein OK454_02430 [Thaumarchaeota archaeon]|jgi:hypothetical protein|nr:hypothetical protein [Nitrososphaerota archaeon]